MLNRIISLGVFAKVFTFGLLLLFIDVFGSFVVALSNADSPVFDSIPFFAAGIIICFVSLLFLLIDWLSLPFGTHAKRVKFYQGAGNIAALILLLAGCFIKNSPQTVAGKAALIFSFSGLIVAIAFNWLGAKIADLLSRKKIKIDAPSAAPPDEQTEAADAATLGKKISPKVQGNSITQH